MWVRSYGHEEKEHQSALLLECGINTWNHKDGKHGD
jgi:hypothetical protein